MAHSQMPCRYAVWQWARVEGQALKPIGTSGFQSRWITNLLFQKTNELRISDTCVQGSVFFRQSHPFHLPHASCPKIARHWIVSLHLFKKWVFNWKWPKMAYVIAAFILILYSKRLVFVWFGFGLLSFTRQMTKTWHKTTKQTKEIT